MLEEKPAVKKKKKIEKEFENKNIDYTIWRGAVFDVLKRDNSAVKSNQEPRDLSKWPYTGKQRNQRPEVARIWTGNAPLVRNRISFIRL